MSFKPQHSAEPVFAATATQRAERALELIGLGTLLDNGHAFAVNGWSAGPASYERSTCSRCLKSIDDLDAMSAPCSEFDGGSL